MERGKLLKQEELGTLRAPAVGIWGGPGGEGEQLGMGAEHNNMVGCEGLALAAPSGGSEQSPEGDSVTQCHSVLPGVTWWGPAWAQQEQLPGSGTGWDGRALTVLPVGVAVGWDDGWVLAQ